jgi:prephenate dehydrogenase
MEKLKLPLSESVVSIIGMGLMGGSLGAALVKIGVCKEVRGIVRTESQVPAVVAAKAAHVAGTDRKRLLQDADLVVLATPVCSIEEEILSIQPFLKSGTLLTDLGSTKASIVNAMDKLEGDIIAVGGHPMCGKETSGIGSATSILFEGAIWALVPTRNTRPHGLELLLELISAVGARPVVMDVERHDSAVACVSTLPYLFSVALMAVVSEAGQNNEFVRRLASSGLRDTSRLAASNIRMMVEIVGSNRAHVERILSMSLKRLEDLGHLLADEDTKGLCDFFQDAKEERLRLFPEGVSEAIHEPRAPRGRG